MVAAGGIVARDHATAHRGEVCFLDGELYVADVGLGTACWTRTGERERFASHATIVMALPAMWVDTAREGEPGASGDWLFGDGFERACADTGFGSAWHRGRGAHRDVAGRSAGQARHRQGWRSAHDD